jgi:recombination protein RecA
MPRKATKKPNAKKITPASALSKAMGNITKHGLDSNVQVKLDSKRLKTSLEHIPTGALAIDYLIGGRPNQFGVSPCPGIPKGRIMNLYGHEGSGKTTLALTTVAQVCATGGTVCYIDFENAIVPDYAQALGVPIEDESKFVLVAPETLEDGLKIMFLMITEGVDLIVIDSVGAGVPKIEFNKTGKDIEKHAKVGEIARLWSGHLPKIKQLAAKNDVTIIGISQIRDKIGGMGYGADATTTVQGGKAWRFYSALRMRLKRVQTVKGKVYNAIAGKYEDQAIGSKTRAKLDKCKVSSSQGQEIDFHLRQGEGIDNESTMIDIAIANGIIKKSGSWITWVRADDSIIKVQGVERIREQLKNDDALCNELWEICIPILSGSMVDSTETEEEDSIDNSNEVDVAKALADLDK